MNQKLYYLFIFAGLLTFIPAKGEDPPPLKKDVPKQWVQLKKDLKKKKTSLNTPATQRRIEKIHKTLKTNKTQALELIQKLEQTLKNRPRARAKVYLLRAQVHLSLEQFSKALVYYQKALEGQYLSYQEYLSLLYEMTFLHLGEGEVEKAENISEKLFYLAPHPPSPGLNILKSYIFLAKNQTKPALKYVNKALSATDNPKESWLALGASLNMSAKNYEIALRLLTKLSADYPKKKQYWKPLSSAYQQLNQNAKALASLDLAQKLDFLETESELLHFSNLLAHQGLPLRSAKVMEQALKDKKIKSTAKNHEILGDLYDRAEEPKKAKKHYKKSAVLATKAKDKSSLFAKLGRLYMQIRDWKGSAHYFQKALSAGGTKTPEYLYISLGVSHWHLKNYEQAIKAFEGVVNKTKAKTSTIKTARMWINSIKKELTVSKNTKSTP